VLKEFKGAGQGNSDSTDLVSQIQDLGIGRSAKAAPANSAKVLQETGPLKDTTPYLAGRMIEAIETDETDLIDRLLLRGYDVNYIAPG